MQATKTESARTVYSYDTGNRLEGAPSSELVEESDHETETRGTGAVSAYRDESGVWQHVQPSQVDFYERTHREAVITVYVAR